jgi:hypothetical protein
MEHLEKKRKTLVGIACEISTRYGPRSVLVVQYQNSSFACYIISFQLIGMGTKVFGHGCLSVPCILFLN